MAISWLTDDLLTFPAINSATPDGLLAAGGDLSTTRLLAAYRQGVFPWYDRDSPILWWSPDPRMVLYPDQVHISKSLNKTLKRQPFDITFDKAFSDVMIACAQPRSDEVSSGNHTWIQEEMIEAYTSLHQQGHAHSVECWLAGRLVGGLYGVSIGRVFFGESMFSTVTDSSKVAFASLCQHFVECGIELIDCQVYSDHLARLGAVTISRDSFIEQLATLCIQDPELSVWST